MASQTAIPSRAGKYVTFQISRHYYALEATRVRQVSPSREILPYDHPLPILRGVMVVRGRRVPIVDIRDRLGIKTGPSRPNCSVLLVELSGIDGLPMLGFLADKMTDVVSFTERDFRERVIQQRPNGRPYGRPKTLLMVEALFSEEELFELKSIF